MAGNLPSLNNLEAQLSKLNRAWINGTLTRREWYFQGSNLMREFKKVRVNQKRNIKTKHKTTTKKGKREYMKKYMKIRRKEKKGK